MEVSAKATSPIADFTGAKDCSIEIERCSLQTDERCHCVWNVFRMLHALFHWLRDFRCCYRNSTTKTSEV